MAKGGSGGKLGSVKGADLLAQLKTTLPPADEPSAKTSSKGQSKRPTIKEELEAAFAHRGGPPPGRKQSYRRKQTEPQKERIVIKDPALRRAIIAKVKAIGALDRSTKAPAPVILNDFGEAAFKKVERLRHALEGFTAQHLAGGGGSSSDRDLILRRIRIGAEAAEQILDRDYGFFIGYDFGTSTTKAVARNPYMGAGIAFAIDVPLGIVSGGQPHLWPTVVWWNEQTGQFSPCPLDGLICVDSFKSALLERRAHRIRSGTGMTMAEAATAFLTMHLAFVLGTAIEHDETFKLATINFGVPVAALTHDETVAFFERVIRASLFLIPFANELSLEEVRAAISNGEESPIQYTLHTELAGAIAGYCAAPRYYVGGHMIIDCGSATLDMASFLLDGRSDKPVAIYAAQVEPLGADACSTYTMNGASTDECRRASRYLEHLVYRRTLQYRQGGFRQSERRYPYQIILTGGGIHSEFHRPLFETMEGAFHRPFHRPQLTSTLLYDRNCEPGRLIIADGLARDPIELRGVAMPGDPPSAPPSGPEMITKDQV